jgi:hypothetical protein
MLARSQGGAIGREAKLMMGSWVVAEQPGVVYLPRAALRQQSLRRTSQQSLSVVYSPEAQTDMWIRIAEAIDKDAVNDPALPPVPDAIADEAGRAQAEQDAEREAQKNFYAGQADSTPFGFFAPRAQTLSMGYALVPVGY